MAREDTVTLATSDTHKLAAVAVTVYVAALFTVILFVEAPVLQRTVAPAEGVAESVAFLFEQKLAVGPLVIDTVGAVRELTVTLAGTEPHKLRSVAVTVYVAALFTVMLFVVAPVLQRTVAPTEGNAVNVTFLFEQKFAVVPFVIDTVGRAS